MGSKQWVPHLGTVHAVKTQMRLGFIDYSREDDPYGNVIICEHFNNNYGAHKYSVYMLGRTSHSTGLAYYLVIDTDDLETAHRIANQKLDKKIEQGDMLEESLNELERLEQ